MHTSFHVAWVQVPDSDRVLLFQTLRGAADLVPGELVPALQQADAAAAEPLSQEEIETLTNRGYLTDKTVEQEQQQALAVLRLAAKNSRRCVELFFRFSRNGGQPVARLDRLEEVFSLADRAAGEDGVISIHPEIKVPEVDPAAIDRILSLAAERDYSILPILNIAGMDALQPWLKSQNFQSVAIETDSSDMPVDAEHVANKILSYFEHQVHSNLKCNVDGMSPEQIKALYLARERVRQIYPSFMVTLVSDNCEETGAAGWLAANGRQLPYISSENQVVMKMLFRFITTPMQINYAPFFGYETARLVYDVGSDELTYESPESGAAFSGFDQAREAIELEPRPGPSERWSVVEQATECISCKHALVCGRRWIEKYGYENSNECAQWFERRMEQVLPSLLHSLRGNLRPPGSAGKKE
jgi:hypothetical protein